MTKVATTAKKVTVKKVTAAKNGDTKKHVTLNKILITQPRPDTDKSPYFDLAKKYNLEFDFHPFIRVEGVLGKDFRKQKIDIAEYTAIVFNSRSAVDHFFRICEELKVKISQDMKYFCITEAVALYLQKFILYRKRKVFYSADGSVDGLKEVLNKHKNNERFIVQASDMMNKNEIKDYLIKHNADFVEATYYRTVTNDISPVMKNGFDMIVFFSPFSVQALFEHDPKFKQNGTLIGAFGPTTSKAVEEAGLRLDVKAPAPNSPSMVSALESYLKENKK
ncbi:MAG TPA: uroporphyrinogen-III synthase [Flavipsychrobacter sp.]|nr:uroporphyrinogen-III synthase [Flavipsychrobacter sp.]